MKIAVLGAGAYGTALGNILIANGHQVSYYDPALIGATLDGVIFQTQAVFLVVPSDKVEGILPQLSKDVPLIVATKGILTEAPFKGFSKLMVLSGPGFADDLKAHKLSYLTITNRMIQDLLNVDYLRFELTNDLRGVLMCGALKNVFAILAGYRGYTPDNPNWATFVNQAADEMREIMVINGAERDTVDLSCGIGDLKLTCNLPSRNFQYGQKIKADPKYQAETTVEGIAVAQKIRDGVIKYPESSILLKEALDVIKQ